MERFVLTNQLRMDAIYVCGCWIRSLTALQGNGGVSRNISLSIQHGWDLSCRIQKVFNLRGLPKEDFDILMKRIQALQLKPYVFRLNPILAGLFLLDHQFKYLRTGTEVFFRSSRLRAFSHVYSGLRRYNLVDANTLWEDHELVWRTMCDFCWKLTVSVT
jgi:hypothetical protein